METPICDFVRDYCARDALRLHMPGHKGRALLGMEPLDITEFDGADELYAAAGIIRQSEEDVYKRQRLPREALRRSAAARRDCPRARDGAENHAL